ncbi:PDR/VanB family oxidoreductase [Paraburkholderia sp. J63]|uniref:PDR/VanB family oxidoreductase n=1 Tax=Paraburkholderia sp. J63 TaxID=2805434 RepID=UPI002ABD2135|nr:PDR/VanB family oxidoreductase [Paraburkholderia sp. J63]
MTHQPQQSEIQKSEGSRWPLELELVASKRHTAEIRGFTFKSVQGASLPGFSAGAHIGVQTITTEDMSLDTERSYSLINSVDQSGQYEIAVKFEENGRGGSRRMHALKLGDRVRATLPKNDFSLHAGPQEAVLIAGGIGITPILSMARALAAAGTKFEFHYACRTPESTAFHQEVMQSCGSSANMYFDHGDPSRGMNLKKVLACPSAKRHVYVCGPRPLIDALIATSRELNWDAGHVHFELFGAPVAAAGDRTCSVELRRSQRVLNVGPQQSILDAMIDAGLDPMFDCRRGECGVCAVRVLEGQVDHRDYALSGEDRAEQMCVCVSRAKGEKLVLDC